MDHHSPQTPQYQHPSLAQPLLGPVLLHMAQHGTAQRSASSVSLRRAVSSGLQRGRVRQRTSCLLGRLCAGNRSQVNGRTRDGESKKLRTQYSHGLCLLWPMEKPFTKQNKLRENDSKRDWRRKQNQMALPGIQKFFLLQAISTQQKLFLLCSEERQEQ